MSTGRPSGRSPRLPVAPPAHYNFAAETAARLERRAKLRAAVIALFEPPDAALYSVDVARALGCTVTTAASMLHGLEREGWLVSSLGPAPRSGNGRRTYRRAQP